MRWFWISYLVTAPIVLFVMWRESRRQQHSKLFWRMWLTGTAGFMLMAVANLLGDGGLRWLVLAAVTVIYVVSIRYTTRLTRLQNQEALERWRAKGSPAPLPRYDGTD